jgi:hypothetical protein
MTSSAEQDDVLQNHVTLEQQKECTTNAEKVNPEKKRACQPNNSPRKVVKKMFQRNEEEVNATTITTLLPTTPPRCIKILSRSRSQSRPKTPERVGGKQIVSSDSPVFVSLHKDSPMEIPKFLLDADKVKTKEEKTALLARAELDKMQIKLPVSERSFDPWKIKTSLCKYGVLCERDAHDCYFAHNQLELKIYFNPKHGFKRVKCKNFSSDNYCRFGGTCSFLHDENECSITPTCRFCSILLDRDGNLLAKLHRKQMETYTCRCFDQFDMEYAARAKLMEDIKTKEEQTRPEVVVQQYYDGQGTSEIMDSLPVYQQSVIQQTQIEPPPGMVHTSALGMYPVGYQHAIPDYFPNCYYVQGEIQADPNPTCVPFPSRQDVEAKIGQTLDTVVLGTVTPQSIREETSNNGFNSFGQIPETHFRREPVRFSHSY